MEDLLLSMICEEYDITRDLLLSNSRKDYLVEGLSIVTYILHVDKGMAIPEIHRIYAKRGYPKSKCTVYNHLIRAKKDIYGKPYCNTIYKSLLSELQIAETGQVFIENDTQSQLVFGRIVHKLTNIRRFKNLNDIESIVDAHLRSEFLNIDKYEEENEDLILGKANQR